MAKTRSTPLPRGDKRKRVQTPREVRHKPPEAVSPRYIVRAHSIESNVTKDKDKKHVKTKRKKGGSFERDSIRDGNRIVYKTKVVSSIEQAKKFVQSDFQNFKKKKRTSDFNFSIQPFKGKYRNSKKGISLDRKALTFRAIRSGNIKKNKSKIFATNEFNRVDRVRAEVEEASEWYPVEQSIKRQKKRKIEGIKKILEKYQKFVTSPDISDRRRKFIEWKITQFERRIKQLRKRGKKK